MFSTIERFVAARYLFSARREGFVSVIAWFSFVGIALGVATLIVVMSVMNGFRQNLFGALVAMRGHVTVQSASATPLLENSEQLSIIQQIPGVKLAYPLLERQAIALAKNQANGVIVQGMPVAAIVGRDQINLIVAKKSTQQDGTQQDATQLDGSPKLGLTKAPFSFDGDHVLIGKRQAEFFNVTIGDKLTLLTQDGTSTAFGTLPRQKTFVIAGIFDVGVGQFNKNFVFMPLETAQKFFKAPGQISQIDVFSTHDDLASNVAYLLQKALGDSVRALDWRHADISIMHAVKMERNVMFLILTLIILIASFNIISGLTMMVKDKTRDIAILRTMGATKNSILRIFFLTGASIGGVGTVLGVILGLSFALNIESIRQFLQGLTGAELFSEELYFLSTLPSKVEADEVIRIVLMAIGLSFLATLYPSWRASSLDPVEGLRG